MVNTVELSGTLVDPNSTVQDIANKTESALTVAAIVAPTVVGGLSKVGALDGTATGAIMKDTSVLDNVTFETSQLQHEFSHASYFGIEGNWNSANGLAFENALKSQMENVTNPIIGTYRGTISVTHYYDSATGLDVMIDSSGNFVAAWKLSPDQISNLLRNGNVQ